MNQGRQTISGWGRYPWQDARVHMPRVCSEFKAALQTNLPLIARGMGRSYGDSALANTVLQTTQYNHFISFDHVTGLLSAQAGVTLREILRLVVPAG